MEHRIIVYCQTYDWQAEHKNESQLQHLLGRTLLKQALINECKVEFSEDMIEVKENGKPVLKGLPICFNISHCKGMVVCALSDCPVGVDVEKERRISKSLVRKTCNDWEKSYILNHDYIKSFLELWTLKESWMKMTGVGMRIPFDTVNFRFLGLEKELPEPEAAGSWRMPEEIRCNRGGEFWQIKLNKDYILSVCSEKEGKTPEIYWIKACV